MITTDDFFGRIQTALAEKRPFSFVRFSDGELMLLNRQQYYSEYLKAVSKIWGYTPNEKELVELSQYLVAALRNADITGWLTPRHLARTDYFRDGVEVFTEYIGPLYDRTLVSVDVPYEMLASSHIANTNGIYPDYYEELLRDRHTLVYISCWNLDEELKARYGIRNINSYQIPGEPKFSSQFAGKRQYPEHFNKIREWIRDLDCTGVLCLVGGGVFSKIYNTWFKQQGGVSLDIGSVWDSWAGRCTRGKTRGLDVEDLTYKL